MKLEVSITSDARLRPGQLLSLDTNPKNRLIIQSGDQTVLILEQPIVRFAADSNSLLIEGFNDEKDASYSKVIVELKA